MYDITLSQIKCLYVSYNTMIEFEYISVFSMTRNIYGSSTHFTINVVVLMW